MKKILIIEDEKLLADLLAKKLGDQKYEVRVVGDGGEGLQAVREFRPDLLLLDIILPHKDGFSILEEIRKDESVKATPVVIISNSGQPVEISRGEQLGVKDWCIKVNFNPSEVLEKVKQQIGEAK